MAVKICHVTSAHNANDVRIYLKECISLAKNTNYDVYLVAPGNENIQSSGVNIVAAGEKPTSRIKRMFCYARLVIKRAMALNADIYHLHDPELLRFALELKRKGKKVIFDSHENILDSIEEKTYMPLIARKAFKWYYDILQKNVMPKINGIIVVTPQMIDTYKTYNDNIALIPNYPIYQDEKYFDRNGKRVVKGRFIFAGGISEQWSHKEIIAAIEGIGGVEYYLFGSADTDYLKELKQLPGWSKVRYYGAVSYKRVQEEMAKAQFAFALLKPGRNTFYQQGTLGNTKLFEAMGHGTPVIATDFDLWRPIIEEGKCGICVNPTDEKRIENGIKQMLGLSELEYEEISANCKEKIVNEYNWERCEEKLYNFYDGIISSV